MTRQGYIVLYEIALQYIQTLVSVTPMTVETSNFFPE